MNEIIEFLVRHGYSVLFAWVMAEEVGLPVPSAPILLAAGALAGRQRMYLPLVVAVPVLAATLCDSFWYILGRLRGVAVLRLICRISSSPIPACAARSCPSNGAAGGGFSSPSLCRA